MISGYSYFLRWNDNLMVCFVLFFLQISVLAQTPCQNGFAGPYACENINLLAHIPSSSIENSTTNEVWGWTDALDGNEYVILGASKGVFFFDIANPVAPVYLGKLPTHTNNSTWRTFRVYQNFLFVCSEASGHGMQIFDLTRLRDVEAAPEVFSEDAHYSGFSNCHTLAISEETGYAFACGTNTYSGGLHIVNIQNPLAPVIAGGYELNGYTHEAVVVQYSGPDVDYIGKTVAFCFNGQSQSPVTIVDVTDPTDASTISLSDYPNQGYCHQGWLTEDGGYMMINDELDEINNLVDSLHTIIFDMHDLDNPVYMGFHVGGTSIDHNLIVKGNLVFQSNYTDGLTILDVTNIADTVLMPVAFFDHFPSHDNPVFQGEWMSYPHFQSGVVPVTDINNGMFLLQPDLISVAAPNQVCALDSILVNVYFEFGFEGPFTVQDLIIPDGASFEFNPPSTIPGLGTLVIHQIENLSGLQQIEFTIAGQYYRFSETFLVEIEQPQTWYEDLDLDGYGNQNVSFISCNQPVGYASETGDCDLLNALIYPGAPGTSDGIDNNCDTLIDGFEAQLCFDLDGDLLITTTDIQIFMGNLNCSGSECIADFNENGMTDVTDLMILISDFGEYCLE
jgi:choice-of-anchor B domain-containing protein